MQDLLQNKTTLSERYFLWGILFFLASLASSLAAYYLYSPLGRQFAFSLMVLSLLVVFWGMVKDLEEVFPYKWMAWILVVLLIVVYVVQRMELPRYDFSVGDPSDYFIAGVCSVTYSQDIGYFMPLTATISALGYDILGVAYAPIANVIFYASSIPLSYFVFKKLTSSAIFGLMMSTFLIFIPVSILFSKTSFSEPVWQTLLVMFALNAYYMLADAKLSWKNIFIFYMIIFLAPFLRGEGVLYYGLILFLALYHYWKYTDLKSVSWIVLGTFVLAGSIHLTLIKRSHYLLKMQYNRAIPHITEFQLMSILYGAALLALVIVGVLYFIRNGYKKLPFAPVIVVLSLLFKVAVSYVYAIKKHMLFTHLLFLNEYGLAVGNFGVPITLLMIGGLILLYIRAFKGHTLALMLVILYTVFHLSYAMQAVTFQDVHAMFLYWNRYYLSIFMMINLYALGLSLQFFYRQLEKWVEDKRFKNGIFGIFLVLLVWFSMNGKMYQIAVTEAHQKNSYRFYEWVKEKIDREPMAVVMDSSIVYKQNKEHIGLNDIKYFVSRMFSVYKMNVKSYQRVQPHKLKKGLKFDVDLSKVRYVLCLGDQDYHLENGTLTAVEKYVLPLEWREHFGLDKDAYKIHQGDVTKSVVRHLDFHATLYRVDEKLAEGKKVSFKKGKKISAQMLGEGWSFINNRSSAFAADGVGMITLPKMKKIEGKVHTLQLRYAVINATEDNSKVLTITHDGYVLQSTQVTSHLTQDIEISIPDSMLSDTPQDINLKIEAEPRGQIMLRSIVMNVKGES